MSFLTQAAEKDAVSGISFQLRKGKTLAIVGESGSGKSVTALAIMGLLPPTARVRSGQVLFQGSNLLVQPKTALRKLRGGDLSMIFQDPLTSLHPTYTVGNQIVEALRLHTGMTGTHALDRAVELLRQVGIPSPEQRLRDYPHSLSGGMCQRAMIAMALACNPKVLIADEPTTALDVTVQAQILDLMSRLQQRYGTSAIMITHDLGVVAETADEVVVMYSGNVVEVATVEDLFQSPQHPYTVGLLASMPRLDTPRDKLFSIPGTVRNPSEHAVGCAFEPRCPFAVERCRHENPTLVALNSTHRTACLRAPLESVL
ncbi:MAG TPA: ABC transporter ATP-binding protein [Gammaproteobacteria bacterium]|nr:ABC transporter ATP-binding protein [Gammaproteobacteria bacterium]